MNIKSLSDLLTNGKKVAQDLDAMIKDPDLSLDVKQEFFQQHNGVIKECMSDMNKVISDFDTKVYEKFDVSDEESKVIEEARGIISQIQGTINMLKQMLTGNIVNQIQQQVKPNISQKTLSPVTPPQSDLYVLVCDEQMTMIEAHGKGELNEKVNTIANTDNYNNIMLYKLTPVSLKKKTVLDVE